jgi:hypothetical protein
VNALPIVSAGANQALCAGSPVTLSGSGAATYAWNNNVQNGVGFTPTNTQTYTVSGTDANGCTNTAQVTVTVNALPTVSAGANQTLCAGSPVTLSGSGAATYTWNNGITNGVSFTPASTQTYTVTGTNANGCTNTAQVQVSVNALPTVSAGANQTLCAGLPVTLSGSGATTYVWNNGITNGVAFTPTNTQTYTVSGTDANGCTNTAQVTIIVNSPSSSTITQTACDQFILNGQNYTQSGTYTQVIPNSNGCDSTITLQLTLNYSPITPIISVLSDTILSVPSQQNVTYQWINCITLAVIPNATNDTIFASTNGQYSVVVSNGCGSDTSDCITIDNIELNELPISSLTLYPNPTFNTVFISGLSDENSPYELMDMQGRMIEKGFLSNALNTIDLLNLPKGLYWLSIENFKPLEIVKQ